MRAVDQDRTQSRQQHDSSTGHSTGRAPRRWSAQRSRARFGSIAGLALAVPVLLAGCGSSSSASTVTPQAPASSAASAGSTALTIVTNNGADKVTTWTLNCDPAGGTHPHPDKACAALADKGRTALPPVGKGMMCSQIFAGPQTATVSGTWEGKPVNASFSRRNGCEVSRWQAMDGLLPTFATGGPGAS